MNRDQFVKVHPSTKVRAHIDNIRNELFDTFDFEGIIHDKPYTFVRIAAIYNNNVYFRQGFAKVMRPDIYDPNRGIVVATKFALDRLAEEIYSNR
jgi:hypothetical protein